MPRAITISQCHRLHGRRSSCPGISLSMIGNAAVMAMDQDQVIAVMIAGRDARLPCGETHCEQIQKILTTEAQCKGRNGTRRNSVVFCGNSLMLCGTGKVC